MSRLAHCKNQFSVVMVAAVYACCHLPFSLRDGDRTREYFPSDFDRPP